MIVRMWEVRAQQRTFTELLTWVCDVALPAIEVSPLHIKSEVFSSPDFRAIGSRITSIPQHLCHSQNGRLLTMIDYVPKWRKPALAGGV